MAIDIDLTPITVLIIDDSRYARSFIRAALHSFGVGTILEAGDGPVGLQTLQVEAVDVVIVDFDMAPMDGITFTRALRGGLVPGRTDTAVIMIAADSSREVVVAARDAGVTEFLAKPLSTESLYRRVRSILTNPRAFVTVPGYIGPDRRTLARPIDGQPDRRVAAPLARPAPIVRPTLATPPPPRPTTNERTGRRRFAADTLIFNEGDPGDVAYVVESGAVSIFKTIDGHAIELGRIGANGVFGEMALIDGQPRMAAARALGDTVCLVIPMAALGAQIGKTPELVILVLETLLNDIRRMGHELGQIRAAIERRRAARDRAGGVPATTEPDPPQGK